MSVVVKIGGGLLAARGALDAVCGVVREAAWRPVLVVPGGGPFADAVRAFEREVGLSTASAHAMAILAMDQYAYALAERLDAPVVDTAATAAAALRTRGVSVLAPSRWIQAASAFPAGWEVTSDSIAAFVAGALDVERLVLVKPVSGGRELLDSYFAVACPVGLAVSVVGCDRLNDLRAALGAPPRTAVDH